MRRGSFISVFLAVACLIAGCGSDDDSADETTTTAEMAETTTTEAPAGGSADEYTAAFATGLAAGGLGLSVSPEVAECVAPRMTEIITVERLEAKDVTVDEVATNGYDISQIGLDEGQGKAIAAALAPCGLEPVDLFARNLVDDMTEEQIQCAADNLDPAQAEALLAKSIWSSLADGDFDALAQPAQVACNLPAS